MPDGTQGSGRVFGIDLGTTYSAIAYLDDTGRPTVLSQRRSTTPRPRRRSSTSRRPTNVVVGEAAKHSAVLDPASVVALIKREMGKERAAASSTARRTPRRRSPR